MSPAPALMNSCSTTRTICGKAGICLIHQANYLLDRQIQALERQFVQEGGYSEQLAAARLRERKQRNRTEGTDPTEPSEQPSSPACPVCHGMMVVRTAKKGPHSGAQFWGCAKYPNCKGSRPL